MALGDLNKGIAASGDFYIHVSGTLATTAEKPRSAGTVH